MDQKQEIKLLKATVRALYKLVICYRTGEPTVPKWVFDNINKAQAFYGEDFTKISLRGRK